MRTVYTLSPLSTPTAEEASELPVGEPELRSAERVLAVDPPGEAVPDERCVDTVEERLVVFRRIGDQRSGKRYER